MVPLRLCQVRKVSIPFKLLLLGLVAILKVAIRARRKSGRRKMRKVVKVLDCSGIHLFKKKEKEKKKKKGIGM